MSVAHLQQALAARERQIAELIQRLEVSESMNETLAAALRDKESVCYATKARLCPQPTYRQLADARVRRLRRRYTSRSSTT